jgi:predicted porin
MKKSLLALAVLGAFAASAQAQTSVTIYGSFDGGIRHQTNVDAAGNDRLTMGSTGTYNSNRLGFRGVEDLGGGMSARFNLEAGFNTGTGALNNANNQLFERTATVGIGGQWGFIDLGRQYTVAFRTIGAYDPLSYKFPGIALAVPATAGTRYNNDIQYTGTFGPLTARAEYALGEVAGATNSGSAKSIGATWAQGPFTVGGAYTLRETSVPAGAATSFENKHFTVGGAVKFGITRVAAGYANQKQDNAVGPDTENKWMWVGANFAVTPALEITPAYYRNKVENANATNTGAGLLSGKKDLYMLSASYALSKRTNLYALVDQARLEGPLRIGGVQTRQRDIAIGVNHLF